MNTLKRFRKSNQRKKYRSLKRRRGTKKSLQKGGKPLMCSPAANTKSVDKQNTCFTPEVLLKIKTEYNKRNPKDTIQTNEVRQIWEELKKRMTSSSSNKCKGKNELCWLKSVIPDSNLLKNIKEKLYAPEQPDEWKNNPDEWLSNYDIYEVMKQYEDVEEYADFKSMSPTSIDFDAKRTGTTRCVSEELCKFSLNNWLKDGKKRFGIVFNLDKHTGPGSHWVTLFVDTTNSFMFFFDSAGDGVPKEVKVLMDRIEKEGLQMKPIIRFKRYDNDHHDHQKGNTECGMYSLFFMITMLTGKLPSQPNRIMTIDERIQLFLKKKIPDKTVFDYRDLYFNPEL